MKLWEGTTKKIEKNVFKLQIEKVKTSKIPEDLATKIRASILFAGPLLARTGKAVLPSGRRRYRKAPSRYTLLALTELGARVETDQNFSFIAHKLMGEDIFLDEASVTATENAIMAASLAEGTTIISNAASEPHVQELCKMLNKMGAKISGVGSNILTIEGVKKLNGTEHRIGPDYMEIGSFIGLAAVTRGQLKITDVEPRDMRPLRVAFGKLGIGWSLEGTTLTVPDKQKMQVNCDLGGMIPKIDDAPWPGFPPDLTSIMTVIATQVEGTVLIHEKCLNPECSL